ncbi:hypothetical protein L211DRAFT_858443 [Terfezia boudieri ATCC MYA-4762]|uniref:Dynein heavy chain ATP-binding dynein motor region domain-containing protein n=1 Tax=Terfezia boudieri ATCC MYA-4762 TaxID=1051890 RepID=A0A3N4LF59_9PEZI|nr:hypothetical protein L211DRAFT_858443 [Terfezia boudieri ATCC MYA-4762]
MEDAVHLDPILNHMLNKEHQRTGGHPSANFPSDVYSRTTFVNFTVTQNSLQTQSLNQVLSFERAHVDQCRSNLMKLQGVEFKLHLRQLKRRILQALNESRGNILDDDLVIDTLETLKNEAAEVSRKWQRQKVT